MGVNRVDYNNETLIDLSSDTVTASNLLAGTTAHDANGDEITGSVVTSTVSVETEMDEGALSATITVGDTDYDIYSTEGVYTYWRGKFEGTMSNPVAVEKGELYQYDGDLYMATDSVFCASASALTKLTDIGSHQFDININQVTFKGYAVTDTYSKPDVDDFEDTFPTTIEDGKYLWTCTEIDIPEGMVSRMTYNYTVSYFPPKTSTWTGTQAEYEAQKDSIPNDTYISILDDEVNAQIFSDTTLSSTKGWSSQKIFNMLQTRIYGKTLEVTNIASSQASCVFEDMSIQEDSIIDVYDSIFGLVISGITVETGKCTVTFPAQSTTHNMKIVVMA